MQISARMPELLKSLFYTFAYTDNLLCRMVKLLTRDSILHSPPLYRDHVGFTMHRLLADGQV